MAGCGQIEDGQASVAEPDAGYRVDPYASIIRTTMRDGIGQGLDLCLQSPRVHVGRPQNTGDTAHDQWIPNSTRR